MDDIGIAEVFQLLEEERQQYEEPCREDALLAEAEDRLTEYVREVYEIDKNEY